MVPQGGENVTTASDVLDELDDAEFVEITQLTSEPEGNAEPTKTSETSAECKPTGKKQLSQSQRLMELVEEENAVFFHDETGAAYAAVPVESRREIHAVRSKRFRLWLTRLFYGKAGSPPGSEALRSVQDILEARALFDGQQKKLSLRTATGADMAFYYDLGAADWSAVRIDDDGWRVIPIPPILFKRRGNTGPQVVPQRDPEGRGVTRLLDFVNVKSEVDQRLLLVYACLCTIPEIPHFVLAVTGEKGAGKSFLLRLLRRIIDPAGLELASLPHDKGELALHLASNYFAAYDNLDNLQGWQSDMLCTAATGGGVSKRELYSDADEIILKFRHCIGLNGITSFVTRPDLMDRTILIELQRIDETERTTEHEIETRFEQARPYILSGIFDTLATARMLIADIQTDSLPRMADAARWGAAISAALGYDDGQFFADLRMNAGAANDETIRANPVAAAMVALMAGEAEWDGTPGELLERLTKTATDEKISVYSKSWPDSAASLSKRLKLVRSNLREAGIEIEQYRDKTIQRNRRVRITTAQRVGNDSVGSSNVVKSSIFDSFGTQ